VNTLRIDVLHHEGDTPKRAERSMMHHIAQHWKRQGHEVRELFGCHSEPAGDLLILHVNLSVIPDDYLQFAKSYPRAINAGLTDIRKRVISGHLLGEGDDYDGPVIVKTDLNAAGVPERHLGILPPERLSMLQSLKKRIGIKDPFAIHNAEDYLTYPSLAEVPRSVFSNRDLVVEKFLPEQHGEEYFQRRYHFLGDAEYNEVHATSRAIHAGDAERYCLRYWEEKEIPEAIKTFRMGLKADFGKIDYVLKDGEVVVFDVNRTPSVGAVETEPIEAEWVKTVSGRLHCGLYMKETWE
jgi:hypothetical protein